MSASRNTVEKNIGRPLVIGEVVHHEDKNRQNNALRNLVLCKTNGQHLHYHVKPGVTYVVSKCVKCNQKYLVPIGKRDCNECGCLLYEMTYPHRTVICKCCNTIFKTRHKEKKYCMKECRDKYYRMKKSKLLAQRPTLIKTCITCYKEFKTKDPLRLCCNKNCKKFWRNNF